MEAEDLSGSRLRIAAVREPGNDARAFVEERERLLVVDPFQLRMAVASGLILNGCDILTDILFLGLDDTDGDFIDEEDIVRRTDISLILANRYAWTGIEVDRFFVLHNPAGFRKQPVNAVAGGLFRILIRRHGVGNLGP